jgi:hypothetical protein
MEAAYRFFAVTSRLFQGPTQHHTRLVLGMNRPESETERSLTSAAGDLECMEIYLHAPIFIKT